MASTKKARSRFGTTGAPTEEKTLEESSKRGSISGVAIAIAAVGVGAFALVLLTSEPPPPPRQAAVAPVNDIDTWNRSPLEAVRYVPERDFVLGPADAAVSIVAFSDFECPYCKDAHVELKRILERYPSDVRLVFKNYPLDMQCNENVPRAVHLHSCKAAMMARCAGAQDRFWQMHDTIFALPQLSVSALDALPDELGLSTDELESCIAGGDEMEDIRADIREGKALGLTGTPAVYVNGRRAPSFQASRLAPVVEHVLSAEDASPAPADPAQ